jgi:hypothetical protein
MLKLRPRHHNFPLNEGETVLKGWVVFKLRPRQHSFPLNKGETVGKDVLVGETVLKRPRYHNFPLNERETVLNTTARHKSLDF